MHRLLYKGERENIDWQKEGCILTKCLVGGHHQIKHRRLDSIELFEAFTKHILIRKRKFSYLTNPDIGIDGNGFTAWVGQCRHFPRDSSARTHQTHDSNPFRIRYRACALSQVEPKPNGNSEYWHLDCSLRKDSSLRNETLFYCVRNSSSPDSR